VSGMYYLGISLFLAATVISIVLIAVHIGFRAPRRVEQGNPEDFGLAYEEVWIRVAKGRRLFAWWLPVADTAPSLLVLHGWGGNAELMLPLAVFLHRAGINILLLDARNHGRSDCAGHSSLPRFAEDAGAGVDWIKNRRREGTAQIGLLGHSVGAAAVLFEASRRTDISAVISISAFAHPAWMMHRYLDRFRIPGLLQCWILRYVEWVIGHRYEEIAPMNTACRVRCPVLLVHGSADETVPVTDAWAIRNHCRGHKPELILVDGGRHDSVESVEQHGDRLVAFLKRARFIQEMSG